MNFAEDPRFHPERLARLFDQIDSIESLLCANSPAEDMHARFKAVEEILVPVIDAARKDPESTSVHCMRRYMEDALDMLRGVQK